MVPLLLALAAAQDEGYYPLKQGTTWTFKGRFGTETAEIVNRINGKEKVGDVECVILESTRNGVTRRECLAVAKDGLTQFKYGDTVVDPPLVILQYPMKVGATWSSTKTEIKVSSVVDGEEDLVVPAGSYKTVRVVTTYEAGRQKETITTWYAKGVGPVLIQVGDYLISLQKFEPGKE